MERKNISENNGEHSIFKCELAKKGRIDKGQNANSLQRDCARRRNRQGKALKIPEKGKEQKRENTRDEEGEQCAGWVHNRERVTRHASAAARASLTQFSGTHSFFNAILKK